MGHAAGFLLAILASISARLVQLVMSRKKIRDQKDQKMDVNKAVSHLYLSNPFKNKAWFFSTHPPLEDRVGRLRDF